MADSEKQSNFEGGENKPKPFGDLFTPKISDVLTFLRNNIGELPAHSYNLDEYALRVLKPRDVLLVEVPGYGTVFADNKIDHFGNPRFHVGKDNQLYQHSNASSGELVLARLGLDEDEFEPAKVTAKGKALVMKSAQEIAEKELIAIKKSGSTPEVVELKRQYLKQVALLDIFPNTLVFAVEFPVDGDPILRQGVLLDAK